MNYPISSAAIKSPETTAPSTTNWREFWGVQSHADGTDWPSIISQHFEVCDHLRGVMTFWDACRDADSRKAQGLPPRYIEASRWQSPPDNIPDNWNEMSVEALTAHFDRARRRDGAAQPTVEALMLDLRERGTQALEEPAVRRRLRELSEQQLHEVSGRLQRLKPEIARAWTPEEITIFIDTWNACHG